MDGTHDSGLKLLRTLDEQVIPALVALGSSGHLAIMALQALRAAVEKQQGVTGTVLNLDVQLQSGVHRVSVQVVVTPPVAEVAHGNDDATAPT